MPENYHVTTPELPEALRSLAALLDRLRIDTPPVTAAAVEEIAKGLASIQEEVRTRQGQMDDLDTAVRERMADIDRRIAGLDDTVASLRWTHPSIPVGAIPVPPRPFGRDPLRLSAEEVAALSDIRAAIEEQQRSVSGATKPRDQDVRRLSQPIVAEFLHRFHDDRLDQMHGAAAARG